MSLAVGETHGQRLRMNPLESSQPLFLGAGANALALRKRVFVDVYNSSCSYTVGFTHGYKY